MTATEKSKPEPRPESTEPAEAPREPVVGQPSPGAVQDQEASIVTFVAPVTDPIADTYGRIADGDVGYLQGVARAALALLHVGIPAQTPAQDAGVEALRLALLA